MALDVERLRADTPGCANLVHFNNAGGSLVPRPVHAAIVAHLEREMMDGVYAAARVAEEDILDTYQQCAALVGAEPSEIALVDSATRAWSMAFAAVELGPGDRVLASRSEYASNYLSFLHLQRTLGFEIQTIPADEHGQIDLAALQTALEDRHVRLVALTHVPTNSGMVQPAGAVGELTRARGVPLLLDACQSVGQVDLRSVHWDLLSATSRKYLRGPRGAGFLAIRSAWLDRLSPAMIDLGGATWTGPDSYALAPGAKRFELWERSIATVLGLRSAVRYALDLGIEPLETRIAGLASLLRARLAETAGVTLHDRGTRRCGLVTFTIEGVPSEVIRDRLATKRVNVSVSSASSTLLDMQDRGLETVIRASVHAYNTEAEIDRFVSLLTWG